LFIILLLDIKIIANVIITYRVTHLERLKRSFNLNYEFKLNHY
jgi:hypothetical protein